MAETKTTRKSPATKKAAKKPVTDTKDLGAKLQELQTDLSAATRSHKSGELVNPRVLTALRKDIARVKTAIRANELGKEK